MPPGTPRPAGAPSQAAAHSSPRAGPAACLTFSPAAPLRHPPSPIDPGLDPTEALPDSPTGTNAATGPPAHRPPARLTARGWLRSGPPTAPRARTAAVTAAYASPPPRTTPPGHPHREGTRSHRESLHPPAPLGSALARRTRWLSGGRLCLPGALCAALTF